MSKVDDARAAVLAALVAVLPVGTDPTLVSTVVDQLIGLTYEQFNVGIVRIGSDAARYGVI